MVPPNADAAEHSHDRAGRDKRPDTGNGKSAHAGKPSERSPDDSAGTSARDRAFRRFGVLLVGEILGALIVREQYRNICTPEA